MKGKLCICIPTRNRSEWVKENLEQMAASYCYPDLSVIYFDSSDDSKTEKIIRHYMEEGISWLGYFRMDTKLGIDHKLFEILKKNDEIRKFQYVWLVSDSIFVFPEAIERILELSDDGYDLIRFSPEGDGSREDYISSDVDEWFHHATGGIAHMASTIMSHSLLTACPDWDDLFRNYIVVSEDGAEGREYFFTVGFYYEQIAKLESFRGIMLGNRMKWRRDSFLKRGKSFWSEFLFEVWARSYPSTILKLPECYTDKETVIRQSDNIKYGRFERQNMIGYRIRGLLTEGTVEQYKEYWPLVSTLSLAEIREIAIFPIERCKKLYGENYAALDTWEANLVEIEKRLDHTSQIIVYGAGMYGTYVLRKLKQDGFLTQIVGIAVTDETVNVDSIEGVSVRNIRSYLSYKERAILIIATLPDAAQEIQKKVVRLGFTKVYFLF